MYLNESIIYIFKKILSSGLCPEDLKKNSDFDTEFYAYGLLNDRLYFRGIRASHIFLDPFDGRWTLQSLKNPGKISKLVRKDAIKIVCTSYLLYGIHISVKENSLYWIGSYPD